MASTVPSGARSPGTVNVGHAGCRVAGRALAHDRVVGREPLRDGCACAHAAAFLADEGDELEFAVGVGVAKGDHGGRQRAFHVRTPAAVEAPVAAPADVLAVPDLCPVGRDDVVVAHERE